MKKFKSFNNREIYNIGICRKKYRLNDFFNSGDYETIINKNNFMINKDKYLYNKKDLDMNELFFKQQIFKSTESEMKRIHLLSQA